MEVRNEVVPSDPAQIAGMMEPGPDGPIFMVNLLKFRDKAEYADDRETDLSGREAYQLYADEVVHLVEKVGGQGVFLGDVTWLTLGQVEELWDEVAIVMYPSRGKLLEMVSLPKYQEIAVHRSAGLKGQLNIETVMPAAVKDTNWSTLAG